MTHPSEMSSRPWPDFAAVRRWHFYAGLFCLPFFVWLAVTGSIYLFRPDIEAWLDRPYENLVMHTPRAAPSAEARAAVAAVPGSSFSHYEPAATRTGAAQVVVTRGGVLTRVYVHPGDLHPMHIVQEDLRPMNVIAHLHGQLLMGKQGSTIVEIAGSWGIVMILTGSYLWFPRNVRSLGGVVYPRLGQRGRLFWRDLHAVTGIWVSIITLFLLLSGLPWSSTWGSYLAWARNQWSVTAGTADWPVGGEVSNAVRTTLAATAASSMPGMTAEEMAAMGHTMAPTPTVDTDFAALDMMVPIASALAPPRPVWIAAPTMGDADWSISSQAQNRPQRVTYKVSPADGEIVSTETFDQRNIVDRVVNVAVAIHEGQFFGRLNQAILLLNAAALILVSVSATVMWWRRRPAQGLGAPVPSARPHFAAVLLGITVTLSLLLPMFGITLVLVLLTEKGVLRRIPKARRWLGLASR